MDEKMEDETIEPLLLIRDPNIVKPKGRPPGALNKDRKRTAAQAEFETSTRREPSRFEHQEEEVHGTTNGRARGRGKPRGGAARGAQGASRAKGKGRRGKES